MFKRLNTVEKNLYEEELFKEFIEHREPIFDGFFILQYAKLRMLELYYNFFDKFCDVNNLKCWRLTLYLAFAEESLYDLSTQIREPFGKK